MRSQEASMKASQCALDVAGCKSKYEKMLASGATEAELDRQLDCLFEAEAKLSDAAADAMYYSAEGRAWRAAHKS